MIIEVINMTWDDFNIVYSSRLTVRMDDIATIQEYVPSTGMPLSLDYKYCELGLRDGSELVVNADYDTLSLLYRQNYEIVEEISYSLN